MDIKDATSVWIEHIPEILDAVKECGLRAVPFGVNDKSWGQLAALGWTDVQIAGSVYTKALELCASNTDIVVYLSDRRLWDLLKQLPRVGPEYAKYDYMLMYKSMPVYLGEWSPKSVVSLRRMLRRMKDGEGDSCGVCTDAIPPHAERHTCGTCEFFMCLTCERTLSREQIVFKCPQCRSVQTTDDLRKSCLRLAKFHGVSGAQTTMWALLHGTLDGFVPKTATEFKKYFSDIDDAVRAAKETDVLSRDVLDKLRLIQSSSLHRFMHAR